MDGRERDFLGEQRVHCATFSLALSLLSLLYARLLYCSSLSLSLHNSRCGILSLPSFSLFVCVCVRVCRCLCVSDRPSECVCECVGTVFVLLSLRLCLSLCRWLRLDRLCPSPSSLRPPFCPSLGHSRPHLRLSVLSSLTLSSPLCPLQAPAAGGHPVVCAALRERRRRLCCHG